MQSLFVALITNSLDTAIEYYSKVLRITVSYPHFKNNALRYPDAASKSGSRACEDRNQKNEIDPVYFNCRMLSARITKKLINISTITCD
eukprot:snap_masked-scaffold_47-processed-gene-1.63-mRNA-1 protein AED:1.00 eAED:1.00 QI:0/0/0/0/1/1/5/0/88